MASPIVAQLEEWEPGQDGSNLVFVGDGKAAGGRAVTPNDGPRYLAARKEWLAARQDLRHLRVADESMAPIIAEGAHVTYAEAELASVALHDKLVVTWVDARPVVRWFQHCGRFALLRAENVAISPSSTLVELEGDDAARSSTASSGSARRTERRIDGFACPTELPGDELARQGETMILPSPIRPVRAWSTITRTTAATSASRT